MMSLVLLVGVQASSNSLPPMPPLLRPRAVDEQAVLVPINALFAAIKAKDGAAMLTLTEPGGRTTAVSEPQSIKILSWSDYARGFRPGVGPTLEERLVAEPAIEQDGDVATVWAPYEFLADGKIVACGTDHFDLVRHGGRWKLLNVTWSQRKPGDCVG